MKIANRISSHLALAAGAMAVLGVLPQPATAQVVGGFRQQGTVYAPGQAAPVQPQPAPVQQSETMMRPGPVMRGSLPVYRTAPVANNGPVYSNQPIYGRGGTVTVQQPIYGRGGTTYYGNGPVESYGPVVTVPEEPYYPSFGGSYGGVNLPPIGPANGFIPNQIPPVGPANGYFTHPIPPVGPANGFFSGQTPITGGEPALLGGYYYGNYCSTGAANYCYPSVYSGYNGFPQYIYSPNITVVTNTYGPDYSTPYLPFATPVYQTTYNQNNYYVANEGRVNDLQAGGERAKAALEHAYPANSFQAAFADVAHAWTDSDIDLLRRHLRDPDTRISVFLDGKYSYSIASSDFSQITRDALDKLHTVSFSFTRLRKAKNGDVTAFGSHVYRTTDSSTNDTGTVPFDQPGTDTTANDQSSASALSAEKTVYVSYTLRRYGTEWDVIATDSADHDLADVGTK